MKLSSNTISVLKNFGSINEGIYFKKGKTLKTVSKLKNVLAEATISEDIPTDFGVADVNNFLSVISLSKDDTTFEFEGKNIIIVNNKGRSRTKYRFCEPTMIITPPEKEITMPDPEISFEFSSKDTTKLDHQSCATIGKTCNLHLDNGLIRHLLQILLYQ